MMRVVCAVLVVGCGALSQPTRRGFLVATGTAASSPVLAAVAEAPPPSALRSGGLVEGLSMYTIVRARDGAGAAAVDLDSRGRVRTVQYVYESLEMAQAVQKAIASMRSRQKGGEKLAVARVPMSSALELAMQPPYKRPGCAGYYGTRILLDPERKEAAKRVTGLDDVGPQALPVFYTQKGQDDIQLFFDPLQAAFADNTAPLREADLFRLLGQDQLPASLTLVASKAMRADEKASLPVKFGSLVAPEIVIELECDYRDSRCSLTELTDNAPKR